MPGHAPFLICQVRQHAAKDATRKTKISTIFDRPGLAVRSTNYAFATHN